ncbi:MAG: MarR family winged helix-turn-helix transcriptional regulator [Aridibacter sp.]
MNINESIIFLFSEITNSFWVKLDKAMKEIGLHGGQIFILISLWGKDKQSQTELASNLRITPPTVNNMVGSLKKSDFIKLNRNPKDRRVVFVSLTEKGVDIKSNLLEKWSELEDDFFGCLSETEKLIILQIFGKMKSRLFDDVES